MTEEDGEEERDFDRAMVQARRGEAELPRPLHGGGVEPGVARRFHDDGRLRDHGPGAVEVEVERDVPLHLAGEERGRIAERGLLVQHDGHLVGGGAVGLNALDRFLRGVLAQVLPYPGRFRAALKLAKLGKPFAPLLCKSDALKPMAAMLDLALQSLPAAVPVETISAAKGEKRGRVAILNGCAQPVLNPGINAATLRLLNRFGIEVVTPKGEGCCGSLVHHMGREEQALEQARHNVDVWMREIEAGGLDAIIVTASGCGTTIKDYGYMLRLDPAYQDKAARVSALAKDITEYLTVIDLPEPDAPQPLTVAYHSTCSMQHGQKIVRQPKDLLSKAGFTVKEPLEGHLCCGSAGTYNIMQPEIAAKLRDRKVKNIEATGAALIATGNIGCMTQIATGSKLPIVHTVELIDWAYGGPKPVALSGSRLH